MLKTIIFYIGFLVIGFVYAQSPIQSATTDELIEKLNPNSVSNTTTTRTRGLRNLTPEVREKPSVNLMINFEFNSSKLLPESKPLLDHLAKAIKSDQLKDLSFFVEGHTDIKGTFAYNLKLSDQRASSVVQYLSSQGVEKNRLKAIGKGSSELLIPDQPEAAENRRVKISLGS
jgi:outer membrane protein OmpA-like peptidoglycan-associated protein